MLGVRLDQETDKRLARLCKLTGHTKTYFAKKALQQFLDDREDYLLGIAALEKKEPTISLAELEKRLGLDH
jgi:RHH-type rel operon transcriptional repressor/antitoxin RelB